MIITVRSPANCSKYHWTVWSEKPDENGVPVKDVELYSGTSLFKFAATYAAKRAARRRIEGRPQKTSRMWSQPYLRYRENDYV